ILALSLATGRAGDITAQPSNGLSITNSVSNDVLPQVGGGAPAVGGMGGGGVGAAAGAPSIGAGGPPSSERGWLSGLHISGYANQTFGMWQNPTALKAYTRSRNNLAVARSLLQIDTNYRLNENNTFFLRQWYVYEPPYSFNSANNPFYSAGTPFHSSFGHMTNGFYNNYQVRDAWWENKTGPLTTFIGNQIVVWGQSVAFRVGDVINPADTCWAFGFANLEQSREAQWMIHPILNLPEFGPLTSNFVELVVQPGFQPRWWPEQTTDPYNKFNSELTAGRVNPCYPAASHGPSARFDVQYSTNPIFGANAPLAPVGPYATSAQQLPGPCVTGGPCVGANLVDPPAAREFFICFPGLVRPGFNPYPKNFHAACNTGLNKHQGNYGPIGDGTLTDTGFWRVPGMQPENWNEGVRFHTLYGATEWTALYYNDNVSAGAPWSLKWTPFTNLWNYSYYPIQEAGVTMDRPLPMPASLAEYFPAVFRGEMLYQNHVSFNDMAFSNMTGQRWSDVVKYMLALDIDQAYAPWLTTTGNLTINLEMLHQIIMDNSKTVYAGNDLSDHQLKNDVSLLFNVGTSWWWSDFAPTWTMIWNPKGDTFALFPSLVLNPPWTKKYFVKLQAIEIMGGDKEWGSGLFKGQSYLIAQLQYNFNLL
ncbi:MAG TPA: hypothetical protein VJ728_01640, partial [Candidatus Binataceae bacterium]|nr:hypothetical protein [Candidatus Binataceae bacterium]